jgi:hypothetical protein
LGVAFVIVVAGALSAGCTSSDSSNRAPTQTTTSSQGAEATNGRPSDVSPEVNGQPSPANDAGAVGGGTKTPSGAGVADQP